MSTSKENDDEKPRRKQPDNQDSEDDDNLLSQAYDLYLTQSESIMKNITLSSVPKKDTSIHSSDSQEEGHTNMAVCDNDKQNTSKQTVSGMDLDTVPILMKDVTSSSVLITNEDTSNEKDEKPKQPKRNKKKQLQQNTNSDTATTPESQKETRKNLEECVEQNTSKTTDTVMDLDIVPTITQNVTSNSMPNRDDETLIPRKKKKKFFSKQNSNSNTSTPTSETQEGTLKKTEKCDEQNTLKNNDSVATSSRHGLNKPERSVESEDESLFGGDFSDNDPTYLPDGPQNHPLSDSDDSELIQLDELLDPEIHYNKKEEKRRNSLRRGIALVFGKLKQQVDDVNDNESTYVAQSIMDEVFKLSWKRIKPRSRWSRKDPVLWKKNLAKRQRAEGLSYETKGKCRVPKIPKNVDCSDCKFLCNNYISEETRKELCRKYWALDYIGKKKFILAHLDIKPTKRILLNRTRQTQRSYSKQCFFNIEEKKINVCQDFFCRTLAISACVISDAIKKRDSFGQYSKENDPRGRHEPLNKTTTEALEDVKKHITSFPSMESHYVRKKLRRKYLEAGLTLSKMYSLYVEECKKKNTTPAVSEMTYRRIFSTEFNLGFFMPKKDQCLLCTKFKRANNEEKENLKQEYEEHIQRKETCNREKENDKKKAEENSNFLSVTFDLQAILQIPSTDVGLLYYTKKLTLYNLTVYENKLPNEAYCFVWNEMHGKKGSAEIGTILYHYLTTCVPKDVTEISLFSDTCGGQNRNQYVAAVLLWLMMQEDIHINVIEHKFLESGHSYMEADSMHSSIETAKKNCDIYCMSDWINIFKRARSKKVYKKGDKKITKDHYHVKEFKYHEFKDLKTLAEKVIVNRTKNTEGARVNWLKIKRMRYVKGDPKIYYSYNMSNDFMIMDVTNDVTKTNSSTNAAASSSHSNHGYSTRNKQRQQRKDESTAPSSRNRTVFPPLQQLYDEPLPISIAKKKDLVNLCDKGVIPEEYHGWFKSLPTEASQVDRLSAATVSDTDDPSSDESSAEE